MNSVENIVDLPTEILITIFTELLASDRRVASECCKRFLEIWLCDVFIDDRCLVFDKCELASKRDPLKTLLKSQRNYRHLIFGKVKIREALKIVEKFGETVTTLEFRQSEYNPSPTILQHLSQFPNLKTIKLEPLHLLGILPDVLRNVELLVLFRQSLKYDNLEMYFDKLKSNYLDKTSDSFRIELNHGLVQNIVNMEHQGPTNILSFTDWQRNKFQSVQIRCDYSVQKMPRFENLKYLELNIQNYSQIDYILDSLEEQFPALEQVSVKLFHRLPLKNLISLKILEAWNIPMEEMARINIFENLEELTLLPTKKCFFVHKALLNKNLKKFTFIDCKFLRLFASCFTCFQTMTKSFPALESFTYKSSRFLVTNDHLNEFATNTPNLKCLTIEQLDRWVSFECLPNLSELIIKSYCRDDVYMIETWPMMLRLRKFHVKFRTLDYETVNLFRKMPSLEDLEITYTDIDGDYLPLFEAMAKFLKRLVNFAFDCWLVDPADFPKIIDILATNCNYLRHVTLPHTEGQHEVWKQLLQKHSSLRTINSMWHFKIRHKQKKINSPI